MSLTRPFYKNNMRKFIDFNKHRFPYYGLVDCKVKNINMKLLSLNDDVVAWDFFWSGYFEKNLMELWFDLTKKVSGDDIVLDIGAYTGIYSILAAKNNCQNIHTFELILRTCERANMNFKINKVTDVITLHPCGLSDKNDIVKVYMPRDSDFLGTGNSINKKENIIVKATSICKVDNIKNLIPDFGDRRIACLKIDVEGHEFEILSSFKDKLAHDKPDMIVELSRKSLDVIKMLESIGYQYRQMIDNNYHFYF